MKKFALTSLAFFLCWFTQAQPISGEYTYHFSGTNVPLYELNQTFATNLDGIDQVFTMELTPRGRIIGDFSAHYDEAGVVIDLSGTLSGRLFYANGNYRFTFAGRGPLSGSVYGEPVQGSETFHANLETDQLNGIATGFERVTVCLKGRPCRSTSQSLSIPLTEPEDGEGDWSLTLNITNSNNHIIGTAQVKLQSGQTVDFRASGGFSSRRRETRLTLRGIGSGAGGLIKMTANDEMNVRTMNGKLFGQPIFTPVENP